jgi:protocatechuate 3,4-dioxygenase beta subunit
MNNLRIIAACALALAVSAFAVTAVDQHWLELWNAAQALRPTTLTAHSRIAGPEEPGTAMIIKGLVVQPDGITPEVGVLVFAYHTDNTGVYFAPGSDRRNYRLKGWAKTDADGHFEFATIRPAPYPNHRTPAHVHFTIETANNGRQYGGLLFADDPLVSESERAQSNAAGRFGGVLNVEHVGQTQVVRLNIRLKPKGDF